MTDELDFPVFDPTGPLWPEEQAVVKHYGERIERELHIRIVETAGGATIKALDKEAADQLKQLADRPEPEHEEDLRLGLAMILARLFVADARPPRGVLVILFNQIGIPLQQHGRWSAAPPRTA